jgi:hypothetical protein
MARIPERRSCPSFGDGCEMGIQRSRCALQLLRAKENEYMLVFGKERDPLDLYKLQRNITPHRCLRLPSVQDSSDSYPPLHTSSRRIWRWRIVIILRFNRSPAIWPCLWPHSLCLWPRSDRSRNTIPIWRVIALFESVPVFESLKFDRCIIRRTFEERKCIRVTRATSPLPAFQFIGRSFFPSADFREC